MKEKIIKKTEAREGKLSREEALQRAREKVQKEMERSEVKAVFLRLRDR